MVPDDAAGAAFLFSKDETAQEASGILALGAEYWLIWMGSNKEEQPNPPKGIDGIPSLRRMPEVL